MRIYLSLSILLLLSALVSSQTIRGNHHGETYTRTNHRNSSVQVIRQSNVNSGRVVLHTDNKSGNIPFSVESSGGNTFASFSPGIITGGAAAYTKALTVSGLSADEYLFYNITCDYTSSAFPHEAWSSTMKMGLTNGSTVFYLDTMTANYGAVSAAASTTLRWVGILPKSYTGGQSLTVIFKDSFTDASGPYSSTVNNVSITIYTAPVPKTVFATFSPGTITGGSAPYTKSLAVSGLLNANYLFYSVTADYASGDVPHDAWSNSMKMGLTNGSTTFYLDTAQANYGILPAGGTTSLKWTGIMTNPYPGTTNLTVMFRDFFTDTSGPYTSTLTNVVVTIYPAPTPVKTFAAFSSGTITGGGSTFTRSLDVSGMPSADYMFYRITGDYVGGTPPQDAYSSTLKLGFTNGSSTFYLDTNSARYGVLSNGGNSTLKWTGVLPKNYTGGTALTVMIRDSYTDASGPYTSSLNNIVVTLYPAASVTYSVAGNAAIAGVTLSYTDGTAKTVTSASDGSYALTVPALWSGTVTPSKDGYLFSPALFTYTNLLANQTAKNHTASLTPPVTAMPGSITSTGFTANWSANFAATGYYLDVASDSITPVYVSGYNNLNVSNVVSYAVTSNLVYNTKYYYRVRAYNSLLTSGSSYWMPTITALPVELVSFKADNRGTSVILNWKTNTEINNSGFEIQRSVSGKNEQWNKIGFINAAGNSNSPKEYSFTDHSGPAGYTLYYRLKQIDNNGNYKYSETLDIAYIPLEFSLSQNYPNPFNPSTVIKYSIASPGLVTLKVYDLLGRSVRMLVNQFQQEGMYEVQMDVSDLPGGVYFYNLSSGNFHQTRKSILLK